MKYLIVVVILACLFVSGCGGHQDGSVAVNPIEKELDSIGSLSISSVWGASPLDDRGLCLRDKGVVKELLSEVVATQNQTHILREKIEASTYTAEQKENWLKRIDEIDAALKQNDGLFKYNYAH
ncbi:MAG: hypothetical protein WCI73_14160 [Phycisphaerae bacterium]